MQSPKLSGRFRAEVISFLEVVKAQRLQGHLTRLLWLYMADLNKGIPIDHDKLIQDLECLVSFLEAARKEQRKARQRRKKKKGA